MANSFTRGTDGVQTLVVVDVDTPFTLERADCPCLLHNASAAATLEVELPQNAKGGEVVQVIITVAEILRLNTSGGAFYINGAKQTDGKYIGVPAVINSGIKCVSLGNNDWATVNEVGTVLVEA